MEQALRDELQHADVDQAILRACGIGRIVGGICKTGGGNGSERIWQGPINAARWAPYVQPVFVQGQDGEVVGVPGCCASNLFRLQPRSVGLDRQSCA